MDPEAESLIGTTNDGPAPLAEPAPTLVDPGSTLVEPVETKSVETASTHAAPKGVHTSAELMEAITGTAVDSPLCFTCGTKMRPAGSCFVCEGCGSTSGCS
jgi:ribonucleoside-diphosphate reductase alpha chain